MGEELKESNFYFKTSEDYELDESERMVFELIANAEYAFKFKFDRSLEKQWKKLAGISPLSKKRTRKLLMAHGFDRNTAQMYANTMYPRNITEIEKITLILEKEGK